MGNGWRTTAIIFIILFILETLLMAWAFSIGSSEILKTEQCQSVVCSDEMYTAFYYDSELNTCECYINGVVKHKEIMN